MTNFLIINFLTVVFFISVVYSTSIKKQTKKQTAFFLIPNSWQVFVETIYDVPSQLLFDNVNVEGEKYFPYISMIFVFIIFNNLIGLLPYSFSKPRAALDAPSFWQTGFQDPARPWLPDEHMAFALSMAVLLTVWLIACCIYFLIGFCKPSKNKLVLSKEFTWVWVLVMVTVLPFIAYGELFELPVARLNPMEAVQEATLPDTPAEEIALVVTMANRLADDLGATLPDAVAEEIAWVVTMANRLADDLGAKGHSRDYVMGILPDDIDDGFWLLEYGEQMDMLEDYLEAESLKPDDSSETELSLSLEESTWLLTMANRLADELGAKGHSKDRVMHILLDEVSSSFWLLEYGEQIDLLEDYLVAEEWCGFYRTIGAVAVCGIAAIAVAVAWWYS